MGKSIVCKTLAREGGIDCFFGWFAFRVRAYVARSDYHVWFGLMSSCDELGGFAFCDGL